MSIQYDPHVLVDVLQVLRLHREHLHEIPKVTYVARVDLLASAIRRQQMPDGLEAVHDPFVRVTSMVLRGPGHKSLVFQDRLRDVD
jgi:hypothetical protein